MNIYFYDDYKVYLKDYIEEQQKKGRGFVMKISSALNIHSSHVSAVINGEKDFTLEQFYSLARFLELDGRETEFLMLLAQYSRAGTHDYKQYLKEKLNTSKQQGLRNQKRFTQTRELSAEEKSVFYSSWIYQAIQLYCSTGDGKKLNKIQKRFNLTTQRLNEILSFLLETGFCKQKEDTYFMEQMKTFIAASSPLWVNNHKNWRLKSIQKSEHVDPNEILYTSTVTLSLADFNVIRNEILNLLKSLSKTIDDSPSEELACLNVDWFLIK